MGHHLFLAAGWIIYCVLHSVLADARFKSVMQSWLGTAFRYYRFAYVIFSFLGLAALVFFQLRVPVHRIFEPNVMITIAGSILAFAGALLMVVCIRKYFMSLSGLRSLLNNEDHRELMITGIHRYVRHPLYLGTFAFIWGLLLIIPHLSLLIMNIIITVYTLIGIYLEEQKLIAVFGEQYERYRKDVPGLWPAAGAMKKIRKTNG